MDDAPSLTALPAIPDLPTSTEVPTEIDHIADGIEADVAALSEAQTQPDDDECVFCYVNRMLTAFGCDTTVRWARRWRDLNRPRATGLERRLEARGHFCDEPWRRPRR